MCSGWGREVHASSAKWGNSNVPSSVWCGCEQVWCSLVAFWFLLSFRWGKLANVWAMHRGDRMLLVNISCVEGRIQWVCCPRGLFQWLPLRVLEPEWVCLSFVKAHLEGTIMTMLLSPCFLNGRLHKLALLISITKFLVKRKRGKFLESRMYGFRGKKEEVKDIYEYDHLFWQILLLQRSEIMLHEENYWHLVPSF